MNKMLNISIASSLLGSPFRVPIHFCAPDSMTTSQMPCNVYFINIVIIIWRFLIPLRFIRNDTLIVMAGVSEAICQGKSPLIPLLDTCNALSFRMLVRNLHYPLLQQFLAYTITKQIYVSIFIKLHNYYIMSIL
jgi:hypothetical protein